MDVRENEAQLNAFFEWLLPQQGAWRDGILNDILFACSVVRGNETMMVEMFERQVEVSNFWDGYAAAGRAAASVHRMGFPEVAADLAALAKVFEDRIHLLKMSGV